MVHVDLGMSSNMAAITSKRKFKHRISWFSKEKSGKASRYIYLALGTDPEGIVVLVFTK